MRELNAIFKEQNELKFIFTDEDKSEIVVLIDYLSQARQDIISSFDSLLVNRLEEGQSLSKSVTQITVDQHMSSERVLYFVDGDETPRFMVIYSINNQEKEIYEAYKTVCEEILDEEL